MKKTIKIYVSDLGRTRKYIGVYGENSSYPVIYFRKSKWSTEKEFNAVLDYVLGELK